MLAKLVENTDNIVHVGHDDNNVVSSIYVQLAEQRQLYQRFVEMIQIDGTHNTVAIGMPLYTFLIQDNCGVGQPVAFFYVRSETQDMINQGMKLFSEVS